MFTCTVISSLETSFLTIFDNFLTFLSSVVGASTSPLIGRSVGRLVGRLVGRSVCLSKKCQKSVKNCQKRGFETTNDCTSEHQEYFNILKCTSVHPSIKQALLSLEAAIVFYATLQHGLLTTHTRSFLWPEPHLLYLQSGYYET